tara:strand:+ start:58228 stop:58449 length:222 start_codon:yes stop_codon:yes gene_type:complete
VRIILIILLTTLLASCAAVPHTPSWQEKRCLPDSQCWAKLTPKQQVELKQKWLADEQAIQREMKRLKAYHPNR